MVAVSLKKKKKKKEEREEIVESENKTKRKYDKTNNKLSNLQKITSSDNNKKKFLDGYLRNGQKMRRVEVTYPTGEKKIYRSMNGAGTSTVICCGSVGRVCNGVYKYATSKIDNKKYSFCFVD